MPARRKHETYQNSCNTTSDIWDDLLHPLNKTCYFNLCEPPAIDFITVFCSCTGKTKPVEHIQQSIPDVYWNGEWMNSVCTSCDRAYLIHVSLPPFYCCHLIELKPRDIICDIYMIDCTLYHPFVFDYFSLQHIYCWRLPWPCACCHCTVSPFYSQHWFYPWNCFGDLKLLMKACDTNWRPGG